jgi:hypothetical protein
MEREKAGRLEARLHSEKELSRSSGGREIQNGRARLRVLIRKWLHTNTRG